MATCSRSSASSRRRPLRNARARASGPPIPCRASKTETPETPAAPDTAEAADLGAAPPAPRSWLKPSAAGLGPLLPADADVDEAELTFIACVSCPADLAQLVNGGLRKVSARETTLKALLPIGGRQSPKERCGQNGRTNSVIRHLGFHARARPYPCRFPRYSRVRRACPRRHAPQGHHRR